MATQTSPPNTIRGRGWRRIVLVVLMTLIAAGLYPLGRYIWASKHYRSAISAINRRDLDEARRNLEICCREWPDSAETHFLAARTARRAGDLKAARELLKEAQTKGWVRDEIELEQALTNLQQLAISGIQQSEYVRLRTMLIKKIRDGHPDALLILEVLAPIADQIAEVPLADECVHRWIELDPSDPRPHIVMGNVWTRLQNKAGATKMYREAVQLDPHNVEARMKLGKSLMIEKLFDQAREQFDWLKQRNPKDPETRLQLAQVEHATGNDEAARPILDDLVNDRPDDPEALGLLGQIQLEANEPEAAEKTLRNAYKIAPYDIDVMYQLFLTLSRLDKAKEAEEMHVKWDKAQKDDQEIANLLRSMNKEAHNPEVRRQIGLRLLSRGLTERGYQWLLNSMAIDQTHIPTHESLVEYYEQHGEAQKAEEHRQIIKLLQQQKKAQPPTRPAPPK